MVRASVPVLSESKEGEAPKPFANELIRNGVCLLDALRPPR